VKSTTTTPGLLRISCNTQLDMPVSESVAVFWDYENCALPSNASGHAVVNKIRQLAHRHGSVKVFKAYMELPEQPSQKNIALRSELQSCGVTMIDCPHNGRKDAADKMMIVDMMAYAIDTPAPATIILISGDRDFVYAVSILCLRQYSLVVLAPAVAHSSLKAQATAVYAWPGDVLPEVKAAINRRVSMSSANLSETQRSSTEVIVRPASQAAPASAAPASPPPSPAVLRRGQMKENGISSTTPPWIPSGSLFTHSNPSEASGDIGTPSSDKTAVESGSEAADDLFDASPSDDVITSTSITTSVVQTSGAAFEDRAQDIYIRAEESYPTFLAESTSHENSWAGPLQDLSEIRLNANALPFRSTYEHTSQAETHEDIIPAQAPKPLPSGGVPPEFRPLIKVLKRELKQGNRKIAFSDLGTLLRQESPAVYERAGVAKLKDYTNLAEDAGIVVIKDNIYGPGGVDGQRWVSLHPRLLKPAQGKVQSSLDGW